MKLCFSTLGCPDWTLEQVVLNGAEYGFDAVELRIGGDRHIDSSLNKQQRREALELLEANDLPAAIISGYTQFCGDDANELKQNSEILIKNAQLAADLHVPYLRTFPGQQGEFTTLGIDMLHEACEKVKPLGVTVLMETHGFMKTGKQAAELIRDVNSTGLGILWDIHHSISAEETPRGTWATAGQYVRHVHLKDVNANNRLCLVGDGVLPIDEIVMLLQQNGFDGYYSFEWEKMWVKELEDPEIALPLYVEYMKALNI